VKYQWADMYVGWRSPQLKIQITPLAWGYGYGFGDGRLSLRLGPIALALYYRTSEVECHWNGSSTENQVVRRATAR